MTKRPTGDFTNSAYLQRKGMARGFALGKLAKNVRILLMGVALLAAGLESAAIVAFPKAANVETTVVQRMAGMPAAIKGLEDPVETPKKVFSRSAQGQTASASAKDPKLKTAHTIRPPGRGQSLQT